MRDSLASLPTVLRYFAAVFLVSVPFWILGSVFDDQVLPGLPISSLMVVVPVGVAAVFVIRSQGMSGLRPFLARAFDVQKLRPWAWLVALATMPVVMLLSAAWQVASGVALPPMAFDLTQVLVLFAVFFVAATAEELGWTGFATRPLVVSTGLVAGGLIVGLVAVLWHVLPLLQADRAWGWIAWWALATVARRVLIVWVYMRGGESVFGASLFHTMSNVSWMLFPVMGSHYDPQSTAVVLVALVVVMLGIEATRARRSTS